MHTRRTLTIFFVTMLILGAAAGLATAQESTSESTEEEKGLWQQFLEWREDRIAATDTYRVSTGGAGYAAIQDTRMTPVVYRAPGFVAVNQRRTYRPEETVLTTFFFQFAYPITEKTISGKATYTNPRGTIDWAYLRRLGDLPLSVGGSLSWSGNLRILDSLGNSALNYDLIAGLNPTARWEEGFTLFGRDASWHAQVTTPLISWMLRMPQYNLSFGGNRTFWAAPWKLYRLRLNVGISRLLTHSQENRFTIDYFYDVYGTVDREADDRLNLGNHTIVFGYALKSM